MPDCFSTTCRNIFEGKKYVEEYRVQDVESELGMTRDKLIQLALLLGSDYTEGVAGIGIVNAVEIVNAFPSEELLVNFRYNADAACHLCCLQLVLRQDMLLTQERRTGCIQEGIKQCCILFCLTFFH